MRCFIVAAMLTLLAAAPAPAGEFETNADWCSGANADPDRRIGACTWLLNSGELAQNDYATVYIVHGNAYDDKGAYDRAIRDYDQAIALKPDFAKAYYNRGIVYRKKGAYDRAIGDYGQAIALKPDLVIAYYNRGNAYKKRGAYDRAIRGYDQVIALKPDYAAAYNSKAWLLATAPDALIRNGGEAVWLARRAVRLDDSVAYYHGTLAAAYAEAGRFAEAVTAQQSAIARLRAAGRGGDLADFQSLLDLYRAGRPTRAE